MEIPLDPDQFAGLTLHRHSHQPNLMSFELKGLAFLNEDCVLK